jgi:Leucine-rich repeat (LRR) protein
MNLGISMTPIEIAKERIRYWRSGLLDLSLLRLKELPELPAGLTELRCSYNCLTRLPDTLPAALTELNCENNQLTTLPETLPAGLTHLYCDNNQLTTLPKIMPAGLTKLCCSYNQLTTLPEYLAAGLTEFYCWENDFPDREVNESIPEYVARVNAITETESKRAYRCTVCSLL